MKLKQLKKEDGFTIIEVLIVLAIAGLIMLVVFLAVPALQRNSRNSQRNNDVSRMAAAIAECTGNNNGDTTDCDEVPELDPNYYSFDSGQQIINLGGATLNTAAIAPNTQCDNDGQLPVSGQGGQRAFTLHYKVETSGGEEDRCINV